MATALPTGDTHIQCSICLEHFIDPRLLPCGHVLCHSCIKRWTSTQKDAKCPECAHPIVEKGSLVNQTTETAVDGLPQDLAMVALVEADAFLNEQHVCVCCNVSANYLCLDCRDTFCQSCTVLHNRMTTTKRHKIENLSTLTPDKIYTMRHPTMCTVHADKPVEIFCPTHEKAACQLCALTYHKSCADVQDLNAAMSEARGLLTDLIGVMQAGEEKLDCAVKILSRHLEETEVKVQVIYKEIDAVCDRLDVAVKACRQRLRDLTSKAFSVVKTATSDDKKRLFRDKGLLVSHRKLAQRSHQMLHKEEFDTIYSELQSRMDSFNCNATLPTDSRAPSSINLEFDQDAVNKLEGALAALGEVKLVPTDLLKRQSSSLWRFHANHGGDVVVSDNGQTADRRRHGGDGVVLSQEAMEENTVYEVRVDQTDTFWDSGAPVTGVTSQPPHTHTLPDWPSHLTPAVVVLPHSVHINTHWTRTQQFSALGKVTVGSRVGVLLDTDHHVHVLIDGQDLGVVTPRTHVTLPAYAVFGLLYMKKVTTCPLRKVP